MTISGEFQHGWVVGTEGGEKERHRDELGQVMGHSFKLTKMKGIYSRHLFQYPRAMQPSQDQPSFLLDSRLLVRIATVLQKSSQQKQITQM